MADEVTQPTDQGAQTQVKAPEQALGALKQSESGAEANPYEAELAKWKERDRKRQEELARKESVIQNKEKRIEELLELISGAKKETSADGANDETVEVDGVVYKKRDLDNFRKIVKAEKLVSTDDLKGFNDAVEELKALQRQQVVDREVERLAQTPAEAELIRMHLEHTVKASGDIKADVEVARILANRHILEATQAEEAEADGAAAHVAGSPVAGRPRSAGSRLPPEKKEALRILKAAEPDKDWSKYLGQ